MQGNDEVGFWTKAIGVVVSIFGACFGVWKHTHSRIDEIEKRISMKADNDEMTRQRDNIADLYRLVNKSRDDVMDILRDQTDTLNQINVSLTSELGKRPTREEVAQMGFNQRGKSR